MHWVCQFAAFIFGFAWFSFFLAFRSLTAFGSLCNFLFPRQEPDCEVVGAFAGSLRVSGWNVVEAAKRIHAVSQFPLNS